MDRFSLERTLVASTLVFGLVFGGNSASGGIMDQALLFYTVLASAVLIARNPGSFKIALPPLVLCVAVLLLMAIQLAPLPHLNAPETQNVVPRELVKEIVALRDRPSISLDPAKTAGTMAWFGTLAIFMFALAKVPAKCLSSLIPVVLAMVMANVILVLLQSLLWDELTSAPWSGEPLQTGFFANPNHLGTLLFMSIPFAFLVFGQRGRWVPLLLSMLVVLVAIYAIGSRAGMIGGTLAIVGSFWIMRDRIAVGGAVATAAGLIASCVIFIVFTSLSGRGMVDPVRIKLGRTGLSGVLDNLPFGTGFGTFADVYRRYERVGDLEGFFANHAHNEYVEIVLEGGVPALVLLVAALVCMAHRIWQCRNSPLQATAALSAMLVLLHSSLDYPLRTFGLALLFCFVIALLFSKQRSNASDTAGYAKGFTQIAQGHLAG